MKKSSILKLILTVSGFIFLLLGQNCVYAERPSNEIPMYGGNNQPFTEKMPPKNPEEAAEFKNKIKAPKMIVPKNICVTQFS